MLEVSGATSSLRMFTVQGRRLILPWPSESARLHGHEDCSMSAPVHAAVVNATPVDVVSDTHAVTAIPLDADAAVSVVAPLEMGRDDTNSSRPRPSEEQVLKFLEARRSQFGLAAACCGAPTLAGRVKELSSNCTRVNLPIGDGPGAIVALGNPVTDQGCFVLAELVSMGAFVKVRTLNLQNQVGYGLDGQLTSTVPVPKEPVRGPGSNPECSAWPIRPSCLLSHVGRGLIFSYSYPCPFFGRDGRTASIPVLRPSRASLLPGSRPSWRPPVSTSAASTRW